MSMDFKQNFENDKNQNDDNNVHSQNSNNNLNNYENYYYQDSTDSRNNSASNNFNPASYDPYLQKNNNANESGSSDTINNPYTSSYNTYVHSSYGQNKGKKINTNSYNNEYSEAQFNSNNPYANQQNYAYNSSYHGNFPVKSTSGYSITSLVLGIISLLVCCCCFPGKITSIIFMIIAIAAIILGIMGIKEINSRPSELEGKGLSISGIVTASIALLLTTIILLSVTVFSGIARGFSKITNFPFRYNFEDYDEDFDFGDFFDNFNTTNDSAEHGGM